MLNAMVNPATDAAGERPRVSIVIPCYNGARFLPEAIESCLRQTMRSLEIIVVDDASPDNCAEIAERYAQSDSRITVIRRPQNGGVAEAFNTGFRIARGDIFTRLAQDDVFFDDALHRLAEALESHPKTGLVYGDSIGINEHGKLSSRVSATLEPESALLFGNRIGLCVAWRRQVWDSIGGFNSEFDAAEDYEYWIRVWNHYPIMRCAGPPLLHVRKHPQHGSLLFSEKQEQAMLRILRESYPTRVSPPWRRKLCQRAAISRVLFGAATDFRWKGQTKLALSRLLRSFIVWPFPYESQYVRIRFPRLKFLLALVLSSVA
jgi:glycosyltransferase involved in cell wall biosynthesis